MCDLKFYRGEVRPGKSNVIIKSPSKDLKFWKATIPFSDPRLRFVSLQPPPTDHAASIQNEDVTSQVCRGSAAEKQNQTTQVSGLSDSPGGLAF